MVCLPHPGTACTLLPHEVGHYTSIRSENCSEYFSSIPDSSQGTIGFDMEVPSHATSSDKDTSRTPN